MGTIFSTRFFAAAKGSQGTYLVPSGHTAVLRSVTAVNSSTTTAEYAQVLLYPGGIFLIGQYIPALNAAGPPYDLVWDGRVVLQAGETIQSNNGVDIYMTASGYLFAS